MAVQQIESGRVNEVVDVLCEAFHHYPVMRYVLGPDARDFDANFRALIRLFVMARVLSGEPLYGIEGPDGLRAAAAVSLPGTGAPPEELVALRKSTWARFDPAARARYDAFCEACNRFDADEPHHHLNMVGVRSAHRGQGLARSLVEHVVGLAESDPASHGVSLSTESAQNVPFYEHLDFTLVGHAVVGPGLETWNFYRQTNRADA